MIITVPAINTLAPNICWERLVVGQKNLIELGKFSLIGFQADSTEIVKYLN